MGQLLMQIRVELTGQRPFPTAGEEMPNRIESLGDFGAGPVTGRIIRGRNSHRFIRHDVSL